MRAESEESSPRRRTAKAESAAEDARAAPQPRRKAAGTIGAGRAAAVAARCVQELTGKPPESVISLEHASDGWRIGIEALESRRIPDSTDILAVYLVILDQEGELVSYRRERRYHRGRSEEEQ